MDDLFNCGKKIPSCITEMSLVATRSAVNRAIAGEDVDIVVLRRKIRKEIIEELQRLSLTLVSRVKNKQVSLSGNLVCRSDDSLLNEGVGQSPPPA